MWKTSVFAGLVAKQILMPLILVSPRTRDVSRGWVVGKDRWKDSSKSERVGGYAGQMERQIEGGGGGGKWSRMDRNSLKVTPHKRQS